MTLTGSPGLSGAVLGIFRATRRPKRPQLLIVAPKPKPSVYTRAMAVQIRSGLTERMPYSLSRWTDLPACKWDWFQVQLAQGFMIGFDPRTAVPSRWSLKPEDTLGLVFWTKDPRKLVQGYDADLAGRGYDVKAHVTITGWPEVEHGVLNSRDACIWAEELAARIGPLNVSWRFSPVPLGFPDRQYDILSRGLLDRFEGIAMGLGGTTTQCYVSFLQPNDFMTETRPAKERTRLLRAFADLAAPHGIEVILCQDDHTLDGCKPHPNLRAGVCVPAEGFGGKTAEAEDCGCVPMIDPFTINEKCSLGCSYCYAADTSLNPCKRNTTACIHLPVLP